MNGREEMERLLEPLLGKFSAQMAVKTASLRALKRPIEQVTEAELPAVAEGLKPILNTLLGQLHTKVLLAQIATALEKKR